MGLWAKFKNTTLYKSIYRNEYPDTPRNQVLVILNSLVLHLHPVKVPRRAVRVSYTWGLGGLSLLMFLILTVTGVWLMFYYVPAVPDAYFAMKALETDVIFGQFTRNLHRWAAHGMVLAVWLHMVRVFYTGAYKPPRDFNWVLGVILFTVTVLLSFTGYLLPWDQLAYWAIAVGSEMAGSTPVIGREARMALLGGHTIGQATLVRWYTLHVLLLPLACIALMAMHFWRVRKDGGISTPIPYEEDEAEAQAPAEG
ncbi:MAG: cytochrome b N-terminal domain-containing protein [Firmicutes bacterium]|nr:cytochrome b N-terminal domain-containing protein [Bacillota bacterium]